MLRFELLLIVSTALHTSLLLYVHSSERAHLPLHVGEVSVSFDAAPGGIPQAGKPNVQPTPTPPKPVPEETPPEPPKPEANIDPTVERTDPDRLPVPLERHEPILQALANVPDTLPAVVAPRPQPTAPAPPQPAQVAGGPASSMRPQGAKTRAHLTSSHKPTYPREAHQRGIQGEVMVWLHVGSDGRIVKAHVHRSSGHSILDDAAVAFAQTLTLRPAREGGRAVESHELLPVYFRIVD